MLALLLFWISPVQAQPPESDIYNHEWMTACREASGLEVERWDDFMSMSYQMLDDNGKPADIIVITLGWTGEWENEWVDCRIKPDGKLILTDYSDLMGELHGNRS